MLDTTNWLKIHSGLFLALFSEIVRYHQNSSDGISEFEAGLHSFGLSVGPRLLQNISADKAFKRQHKIVNVLHFLRSTLWPTLFGYAADSLEKSTESILECTFFLNLLQKILIWRRYDYWKWTFFVEICLSSERTYIFDLW